MRAKMAHICARIQNPPSDPCPNKGWRQTRPSPLPEKLLCEFTQQLSPPPINTSATASRFMSFPYRLDE
jgi:hypothetical protein